MTISKARLQAQFDQGLSFGKQLGRKEALEEFQKNVRFQQLQRLEDVFINLNGMMRANTELGCTVANLLREVLKETK